MSAWTRRDFIRSTGLAGGAAFMTGAAMLHASPSEGTHMPEALLQGVCDLHVHAAPDVKPCLLYTSPSPRDRQKSRMPSSA